MRQTAADVAASEERHAQRLPEAIHTLERWWETDSVRFNARARAIGDYVW